MSYPPRRLPSTATPASTLAAIGRVITFLAPVEQLTGLLITPGGSLESVDENRCRYTTWVDSFEWLAITIAILGIDFHVDEPTDFISYCQRLGDRLAVAAADRGAVRAGSSASSLTC